MKKSRAYYNEINPQMASWLRELIKDDLIAPGEVDERSIEDIIPRELTEFTQCHFFAGIGVWSYALRSAGWPDDRPVWTGSCPCQPFSAAGKGKGFADDRHLWPAFYHLIAVNRPDVVFGEQVANKGGLAWLDLVQSDLEAATYAVGALNLCAAGFGAPHKRQRLFWVADAESARRRGGYAMARRGFSKLGRPSKDIRPHTWPDGCGSSSTLTVADVLSPTNGTARRLVQSGDKSMAVEAKAMRLSGYGNAIVAQVASEFIGAYMDWVNQMAVEVDPPAPTGRPDKGTHCVPLSKGGNDRRVAQIAARRPDVLEKMKNGEYPSVRAAQIDAGIIRELTLLEKAQKLWLRMPQEDRVIFQDWIEHQTRH